MTAESPAVEPAVRAATGAMTEREAWSWPGVMILIIGIVSILGGVALLFFGAGLSSGAGKVVVLVLAVLTQGLNGDGKGLGTLGALITALVVVSIGLSLGGPTGYAINPARDLGPRIVHALLPLPNKGGSDWAYAWVPIAGPLIGAAIAAGIYNIAFA